MKMKIMKRKIKYNIVMTMELKMLSCFRSHLIGVDNVNEFCGYIEVSVKETAISISNFQNISDLNVEDIKDDEHVINDNSVMLINGIRTKVEDTNQFMAHDYNQMNHNKDNNQKTD